MVLNKKGNSSILAVLFTSLILIIFTFVIAFIVIMTSYYRINGEVNTLELIAEKKGGLPYQDQDDFINRITTDQKYLQGRENEINISAYTEKGNINCLNTADLNESGFFIDNTVNDVIVLKITVPSNSLWINELGAYFGINKASDNYTYIRHLVSTRTPK